MGGSPSPPPVPDPAGTSAGQFASNLAAGESAQAGSQVNQVTPTGALTYYQTGVGPNGVPTYTALQQLTPEQQSLLNLQQLGMGEAGGAGANMLAADYGNLSTPPNLSDMAGGETQKLLGQETSYLSPYFTQQTSQLDTQLRNQGIMPGTPAYNQQMQQVQDNQNRAVTGFLTQAEPAAFSQAQSEYLTPVQVAAALMGQNQPGNVNAPYTGAAPNIQPPDVIGATANAQQALEQNYQAQIQQNAAMMSGIAGIGSALIKMSDRKYKRDILPVGELNGVPVYLWRYKWAEEFHVGPMIDEVPAWMIEEVGGIPMLRGDWDAR